MDIIIETKYKCPWCYKAYADINRADKCLKLHIKWFSKVHPIPIGEKIIFKDIYNNEDIGIIVKIYSKENELRYLIETEDETRHSRRWFDVCKYDKNITWLEGIAIACGGVTPQDQYTQNIDDYDLMESKLMIDIEIISIQKIRDLDPNEIIKDAIKGPYIIGQNKSFSIFQVRFKYKDKKGFKNFVFPTNFEIEESQKGQLKDFIAQECYNWAVRNYKI